MVFPDELRVPPGVLVPVARGPDAVACDLNGYLRRILTARVYEIAVRTVEQSARKEAGGVLCCPSQSAPPHTGVYARLSTRRWRRP